MFRNVNQIIDKILQENKLIKKVDLMEDIDKDKSGRHRIDKSNGFLEFFFSEKTVIGPEDFSAVIGNIECSDGHIIIKPILFNTEYYQSTVKQAQILVDKSLDRNSSSLIFIEFENRAINDRLYFKVSNAKHYERLKAVTGGEAEYSRQLLKDSGSRSLACIYDKGIFSIEYYEDITHSLLKYEQINCERVSHLLIDIEKECLIVNDEKLYYSNSPISTDPESWLSISLLTEDNEEGQDKLAINRIIYGCRTGYIYLKPIKQHGRLSKVFVVYGGTVQIQYQDKDNSWIDIDNCTGGISIEELKIRIEMNCLDRIYAIIIAEES